MAECRCESGHRPLDAPTARELLVEVMPGYPRSATDEHGWLAEGVALLAKPFDRADLVRKVRETLSAHAVS